MSLQFLSRSDSRQSVEDESESEELPEQVWSKKFVTAGGLHHLYQIFVSGEI